MSLAKSMPTSVAPMQASNAQTSIRMGPDRPPIVNNKNRPDRLGGNDPADATVVAFWK